MPRELIERQVLDVVCRVFLLAPAQVKPSSRLVYDLGADSSDILDVSLQLSAHFACDLDTRRLTQVATVADFCSIVEHALAAALAKITGGTIN